MDQEFILAVAEHLPDGADLTANSDLEAAGLDSLALVGLLVAVEDRYGVTIPDELLSRETFASPAALWSVLSAQPDFDHGRS